MINNTVALKAIVAALMHITNNPADIRPSHGICGNIFSTVERLRIRKDSTGSISDEIINLFHMWPKFNGDISYPITGINTDNDTVMDNNMCYLEHSRRGTLWDRTSKYGRARWELTYFMIRRARRIIKQIES